MLFFEGASGLSQDVISALAASGCELRVHLTTSRLSEVVSEFVPDLVLIDVAVPHGGLALCAELRATEAARELPIMIVAEGAFDEDTVTRGLLCGADDFVSVRERVAEFQARVRVQLRHKRDRDRLRRLRAERDTLRREASVDPLTNLPNRRSIDAALEEAWSRGAAFSVVFVDVDDFKQVNDCFGHDVGDHVLCAVAEALGGDAEGLVGRWGGEEFVVVLPAARSSEAEALAERCRKRVEAVRLHELGARPVTASFGLASFDPRAPDMSVEALCQRADAALYEAKRAGKNRVQSARPLFSRAGHVSLRMPSVSLGPASDGRVALEASLLRELATGRAGLPVLPEAAEEALRLAEDPRTDIGRIARLVERDPALAARFIAVAGSALYSRGMKPVSTQVALVRIGLATSRDLLLQVAYERSAQDFPVFRAEVARSFERSVRAAIAARLLTHELRVACDSAYLCGLLHDIGESRIYRLLAQMPYAVEHPDLAHELVARHHQRAGAEVARAWRLSPEIIEACSFHHGAVPPTIPSRLVMGADVLVAVLEQVDGPTAADEATLKSLGIAPERLFDVIERVRSAVADAAVPGNPSQPPSTVRLSHGPHSSRYPRTASSLGTRLRTR